MPKGVGYPVARTHPQVAILAKPKQEREARANAPRGAHSAVVGWQEGFGQTHHRAYCQSPHRNYADPLEGVSGEFLRCAFRPHLEAANNLSGEIINLFQIPQRSLPQTMDVMRCQVTSHADVERLRSPYLTWLTELERAARFLHLDFLALAG